MIEILIQAAYRGRNAAAARWRRRRLISQLCLLLYASFCQMLVANLRSRNKLPTLEIHECVMVPQDLIARQLT